MKAGIVGLPNVGKSTLFNGLTRTSKAEAANYPFCTIEPNVGIVTVPDTRLDFLATLHKPEKIIPAVIEMVDIAGLVAGASQGEGLGNQFLSHIRQVDAIVHVVRCFDDEDVIHNMGSVDPVRDIEVISTELVLADMQSVENQIERNTRRLKAQDKEAKANLPLLERLREHLNEGKPANTLELEKGEQERLDSFFLLSAKPVLFACNVAEGGDEASSRYVEAVREYADKHHRAGIVIVSAAMEAELSSMSAEEADEFLREFKLESGIGQLVHETYRLLGLASYLTAGPKEVRAWTFVQGMTAPECAGVIHTDFQRGFIKAEVVSFEDLQKAGNTQAAREAGRYRIEGKEYLMQDGDVVLFRFNV